MGIFVIGDVVTRNGKNGDVRGFAVGRDGRNCLCVELQSDKNEWKTWLWPEEECELVQVPTLDAYGVQIDIGDTVYIVGGGVYAFTVTRLPMRGEYCSVVVERDGIKHSFDPTLLTHEKPDTLESILNDARKDPCRYFDHIEFCGEGEKPCRAESRGEMSCKSFQCLDLLERQRKVLERRHG